MLQPTRFQKDDPSRTGIRVRPKENENQAAMKTTLDLALIRWSVVCRQWHDFGGDAPMIGPFLAGWFMRDMKADMPEQLSLGTFRDSFRKGWGECDTQLAILAQQEQPTATEEGQE